MGAFVRLEVDDGVGVIRLDRPPANAIGLQVGEELLQAIREADAAAGVGAIVVWGGPKIFAAGADVKAMATWGPEEVQPSVDALGDACDLLEAIGTVSIAAVNGYALGGGHGARARLRPAVPRRRRHLGPARDQARRDPRRRRHAAPRAHDRARPHEGARLHRPLGPGRRGARARARRAGRATRRGARDRGRPTPGRSLAAPVRRSPPRRRRSRRRRKRPERRGSRWSAPPSSPCSAPLTSGRGWPRSWRSGPRVSRAEPRRSPCRNIHATSVSHPVATVPCMGARSRSIRIGSADRE